MKDTKTIIAALFLIFIIAAIFTKRFGFLGSGEPGSTTTDTESFITLSVSDLTEEAKWYEYDFGRDKVKFFAVKANDETVKTAFDACDVCYQYKKGYRQDGDDMVCNNCGNRYPIEGLGTENKNPGGCWPGYLPSTIEGDNVIIKKSDLENS